MANDGTLERLYPDELRKNEETGDATLGLHVDRYEFAAAHALGGRLLDIACGAGYGTRLLKDRRPDILEAVGVDISEEAIMYAKARYQRDGIRYLAHDATTFCEPERFDTVVSLETLEHLLLPDQFLDNLVEHVLRPGGILICSAPVTPSVDANPYHQRDYSQRSFRRMFLSRGMKERACLVQTQRFQPTKVLSKTEARSRDVRRNLVAYYLAHPTSLGKRIAATLRDGFINRYLTIVWSVSR